MKTNDADLPCFAVELMGQLFEKKKEPSMRSHAQRVLRGLTGATKNATLNTGTVESGTELPKYFAVLDLLLHTHLITRIIARAGKKTPPPP